MASGPLHQTPVNSSRLNIVRLGAHGDGVTDDADSPQFIPFALPGEHWRQAGDGSFERLSDAPGRVAPSCPHFGPCGGCVAQHMDDTLYEAWKTGLVSQALTHHGINLELEPLWRAPPASRRRVTLSAVAADGRIQLGFREARSHELVEIKSCTIAAVEIVEALPILGTVLDEIAEGGLLPPETRLHVTRADNGIDVFVDGIKKTLSAALREKLAGIAGRGRILRLTVGHNEIFQSAHPVLHVAGADLRLPAGVFVQAVAAAERVMAGAVVRALGRAKRVADLFCGLGTFALPMAKSARVLAIDNQSEAIAALADAVRHAQGLKPVESVTRDLFREPLSRNELKPYDAVVFDPPRAGAAAQSEALAKSKVPCVVAVSCNPATLARDLRILIDGGYSLKSVMPIDQFVYSAHVEAVAVLRR